MNSEHSTEESKVRLDTFDPKSGLDRGRSKLVEIIWYLTKLVFFLSAFPWPRGLKHFLLRCFGAAIGMGVVIKPRVNIHFPWKLIVGDHAWIGEECFILNFEAVTIGAHACLSQRTFLCGGNHDFRSPSFEYRNKPITIGAGSWIGAQSFIGPGVNVGSNTVVAAGSIVTKSLPVNAVCAGNPCEVKSTRWKD
ncbi:MAG: WcaF family extracellular polysaccharide biosynthesis acetyltransferase [Opitutales bacterium]|nr:WcaF family extracellular polysaccharide biosynthesis acetyltransferase [Opitutales bacterium]MDG2169696.1 WcaF family extracellular polysaccharide biosynthesis acetyltransferase [Opitutales bacterium]